MSDARREEIVNDLLRGSNGRPGPAPSPETVALSLVTPPTPSKARLREVAREFIRNNFPGGGAACNRTDVRKCEPDSESEVRRWNFKEARELSKLAGEAAAKAVHRQQERAAATQSLIASAAQVSREQQSAKEDPVLAILRSNAQRGS